MSDAKSAPRHDPVPEPAVPVMLVECPPLTTEWTEADRQAWEVIEAAIDLISAHYKIDRDLVWGAVFDMEVELFAETGQVNFGRALEVPWGISALGIRVAQVLLGEDASGLPSIHLSYH